MRKTIAVCLALSLLACRWTWPHPRQRRRIVVFADLTMSLTPDAMKAVQEDVNNILDKTPGGAQLQVIPICENMEGARAVVAELLPWGITATERAAAKKQREDLKAKVTALFNGLRNTHAVTADYASCISPGLRMIDNMTRVDDPTTVWNTDAVFVSDMIEECRASVLGQTVRLKLSNHQFDDANRLVNLYRPPMNLRDIRVVVILPRAGGELKPDEPLPADLQSFWQRLFARSGITDKRLWWDANVSQYIASIRR